MPLQRSIGLLGLTFIGVSGIIGSGWLFAPLFAAHIAGPASIISWGIGGVSMLILALCFAEVTGILPVAGGIIRIPHFTHGDLTSSVLGWSAWVGYNTAAPIETSVMLQYLAVDFPWLFVGDPVATPLTVGGIAVALGILLLFVGINALGAQIFASANTGITWLKLAIPLVVGGMILASRFEPGNLVNAGGFAPYGIEGVFKAVSAGGIIFALIGFRHVIDLAGEVKKPHVTLPLALTLSLLISMGVYLVMQIAFIGALTPADLAKGWGALQFDHHLGPIAGVVTALGLGWVTIVLTGGAVVAPFGGGLVSTGSMARLAYAMSQNRLLPSFFEKISNRGVPFRCLMLNFAFGTAILIWVPFVDSVALNGAAITLSFCAGPIAVYTLRTQYPDAVRIFRLPAVGFFAPAGFVVATLIVFWSGWNTTWRLGLVVLVGLVFYAARTVFYQKRREDLDLKEGSWLIPYGVGLGAFSYLGGYGGGLEIILFPYDMVLIFLFSLVIFWYAQRCRLSPEKAELYRDRYATDLPADSTPL